MRSMACVKCRLEMTQEQWQSYVEPYDFLIDELSGERRIRWEWSCGCDGQDPGVYARYVAAQELGK